MEISIIILQKDLQQCGSRLGVMMTLFFLSSFSDFSIMDKFPLEYEKKKQYKVN